MNIETDTTNPFVDYWRGLSKDERQAYASRAGTTVKYIETHLIGVPPRKIPRQNLMGGLAKASRGRVSQEDLLRHFYSMNNHTDSPFAG